MIFYCASCADENGYHEVKVIKALKNNSLVTQKYGVYLET